MQLQPLFCAKKCVNWIRIDEKKREWMCSRRKRESMFPVNFRLKRDGLRCLKKSDEIDCVDLC